MIALRADSGNLEQSSLYFSKTFVPCCSAVMGTERFVAGSPFFSPQLSAWKLQNALQFNMAEFKKKTNFKSLNFFIEWRDLVVFPDLVLFGIVSTVSLIWLEWY